jgi:diguanylate cyclase (GGDEF)-like protein
MTDLEKLEARARASFACYLDAIHAVEQHALIAGADISEATRREIAGLAREIEPESNADALHHSRDAFVRLMRTYGDRAGAEVRQQARDLRDMVALLEEASTTMAAHNTRFHSSFERVTTELEAAAECDSPARVRQHLASVVHNLKTTVECLWQESRQSVSRMQSELHAYHNRLAQAERAIWTDPLTGLPNRRAAEARIEKELQSPGPFCMVVMDLNRFKSINDRFGHACGDQVLTTFARHLQRAFREGDVVYRWGGDEFLVVMNGTMRDIRGTLQPGNSMEQKVTVAVSGKPVDLVVRAALGVAQRAPGDGADELFARADANMYQEKTRLKFYPTLPESCAPVRPG